MRSARGKNCAFDAGALKRRSIRDVLPLTADAADIDSEYVVRLAIKLNERVQELRGVNKKIAILEREFGEWHGLGA